jgi:hypothetical protein
LEHNTQLLHPELFKRRIPDDDGNVGGLRNKVQDVLKYRGNVD